MENDFLNSLYEEEEAIYSKIISDSLYNELIEVQRFIIRRGGNPKHKFGIKSFPLQESLFSTEIFIPKTNIVEYDKNWIWDKKTEYGFKKLGGKASPREIIKLLATLEDIDIDNIKKRKKMSANIYNVISRLKVGNNLIKDESVKDKAVYILTKEEYQLENKDL